MFHLLIVSLLSACSGSSENPDDSNDLAALFSANHDELQLLLFVAPGDTRADGLVLASAGTSTDSSLHDVAYDPDFALLVGVSSNGHAALSRRPTPALPSPPRTMFPLTGDLQDHVAAALATMATPQINAFFVSGEDGLFYDTPEPSNRNQRLASHLREVGVAVYFEMPTEMHSDVTSTENTLFVLTGRPSTFPPEVTEAISQHLIEGGPLLLAVEPDNDSGSFQGLAEILGVQFGQGTLVSTVGQVREDIGQASPQDRLNHATNAFLSHESNPNLSARTSSGAQLLFSSASWIQPTGGSTSNFSPTVLSNDAAFGDLNGNVRQDESESTGALVLAGVSVGSAGRPYRAAILADSTMISDRWLLHPTNGIFAKDLIHWLLPITDNDVGAGTGDDSLPSDTNIETPLFTDTRVQSIEFRDPRRAVTVVIQHDSYGAFSMVTSDSARGLEVFRGSQGMDAFGGDEYTVGYIRRWGRQGEEKLTEFGLNQNSHSLNIQLASDRTYRLILGARHNRLNARYALDQDTEEVFLLNYDAISALAQPTRTLHDSRFHGDLDWELIEVDVDGTQIRIERRGDSWIVGGRPADNIAINEWALAVFSLRAMSNEFEVDSVEPFISFYITSDTGVTNRIQLGKATTPDGDLVTVGRTSHTRAWVALPPRTADLVASAPSFLSQAIQR